MIPSGRQGFGEGGGNDALFQKGMAFAQSLPGGCGLTPVSMETDDYDEDSEEVSQSLPSNTNEEGLPLSQQPDSGYESLPLSDPSSLDPSDQQTSLPTATPPEATPTSLAGSEEGEEVCGETGKIESAIPYLIPKDMTLEQLHSKVHTYISST